MSGKRPRRPLHDMCRIRGLSDDLWDLIEICWADRPSDRPTAGQIMDRLYALPHGHVDQRPLDEFDLSLSSRILDSQPEHPFADLAALTDATDKTRQCKR
jgi:hypothetical protein